MVISAMSQWQATGRWSGGNLLGRDGDCSMRQQLCATVLTAEAAAVQLPAAAASAASAVLTVTCQPDTVRHIGGVSMWNQRGS